MEALKFLTTQDVLNFFANSAIDKIAFFAFFVIIAVLFANTRKDRKEFTESCKSLEQEISKLSKVITKNTTADEEKNKQYMREFKHLGDSVTALNAVVGQLRNDITKIHNYCMGKNGYPVQQNGGNGQ